MIIDVYCLCYNEIKLAPFAVQYWKRYAHKVYIYMIMVQRMAA